MARKYGRKRKTYRRKKFTKLAMSKVRAQYWDLFAPRVLVSHKYTDWVSSNLTVNTAELDHTYIINNIRDLDYGNAGTNKQPVGYDTMASLYTYYQVKGVEITVSASAQHADNENASAAYGVQIEGAAYPSELGSLTPSPLPYVGEAKGGKTMIISSDGSWNKMRFKFGTNFLTGLFGTAFNSGLGAYSNAGNPGNPVWFTIQARGIGDTGDRIDVALSITVKVLVEWSMPKYYSRRDV